MNEEKEKVSFDCDAAQAEKLRKIAKRNGDIGLAAQLRIVIQEWFATQKV